MEKYDKCPVCKEDYTYIDDKDYVCPMCSHSWPVNEVVVEKVYKDANGNILVNGDTVVVMKDLKVKGSSSSVKQGTKVKNIRLVDGDHDIECKIDGFGQMQLKTQFVKKQ